MQGSCELCERTAVWRATTADGREASLCDNHRHAAAGELVPLRFRFAAGPESLGTIVARLLDGRGRPRRQRFLSRFRPER